jgi:hypothetical protein
VNGACSVTLFPYSCQVFDGIGENLSVPTPWNGVASSGGSSLTIFSDWSEEHE